MAQLIEEEVGLKLYFENLLLEYAVVFEPLPMIMMDEDVEGMYNVEPMEIADLSWKDGQVGEQSISTIRTAMSRWARRVCVDASLRPSRSAKKVWLGTYASEEEAASTRAVAFSIGKDFEYNHPELDGTFPPLSSQLRLYSVVDHEAIMDHLWTQGYTLANMADFGSAKFRLQSYVTTTMAATTVYRAPETSFNYPHPSPISVTAHCMAFRYFHQAIVCTELPAEQAVTSQIATNKPSECTPQDLSAKLRGKNLLTEEDHVDMKTTFDAAMERYLDVKRKLDRLIWCFAPVTKLEENVDYLKAIKPYVTGSDSKCQSLKQLERHEGPEWQNEPAREDEELNDGSSATDESEAEVTADSPYIERTPRQRLGDPVDEDDLITKLAPFIKKQIEEALNSTLLPLVSVLRSREEDEQKHREKMLALEEEKLALKREKLLFKRRRVTRSQPAPPRASYSVRSGCKKRHGVRVTSPVL